MERCVMLLAVAFALIASAAHGGVVEQTFHVGNLSVRKLCQTQVVAAVNGQIPGPTIEANDGDQVIVHVINESPYKMSIHWHGIFQLQSQWADGPAYVTQCPILPGDNYTYRFTITGQEGTLWWHAHFSSLRATVYGALIIRPKAGTKAYPFPQPDQEVPILLGEWWNANPVDVETQALKLGGVPNISDAFTINGKIGDLYNCSETYNLTVVKGKTYLFRIINAALNYQHFYKVAGHSFTVVAVDASYTVPYRTDVLVLSPGQTIDALLVADATPGRYYMAAHAYITLGDIPFDHTTTTGILQYENALTTSTPEMPILPAFNDTPTAHKFYSSLTGLLLPGIPTVPLFIDVKMFVTIGMNLVSCDLNNNTCKGPFGKKIAASMNNISFELPSTLSLLQAHFFGVEGIYTLDFPDQPPQVFNYTDPSININETSLMTVKGTRLKKLMYNETVEIVLQNTALLVTDNHPMHLHGFNFFVVAQGFGKYNEEKAVRSFNLANPQVRNTIAVPVGGWAVIRFQANNPGVWLMHCHIDYHGSWGLSTGFVVKDGPTMATKLPPPPANLPRC